MNDERRATGNRLSSVLGLLATLLVVLPTAGGVALSPLAWPVKVLIVAAVWVVMGVVVHSLTAYLVRGRWNELARNRSRQRS